MQTLIHQSDSWVLPDIRITWWFDPITDTMHLRMNNRIEAQVTRYEMLDAEPVSYSYDFGLYHLVMGKLQEMVWLSMPGHE